MRSNAGYYLGRTYWDAEVQADLPWSRESGYYRTLEEATMALVHGGIRITSAPLQGDVDDLCITCEEVEATRGEYCDDCHDEHQQDMHDDCMMSWDR